MLSTVVAKDAVSSVHIPSESEYRLFEIDFQGRTQRGFEGVHKIQLGIWGAVRGPPAGSGAEPGIF